MICRTSPDAAWQFLILVDAGPLIALVRKDDRHHKACVAALRRINEPMGTVWPALTKALCLSGDVRGGQEAVLELVTQGGADLLPLDLADAALVQQFVPHADRSPPPGNGSQRSGIGNTWITPRFPS